MSASERAPGTVQTMLAARSMPPFIVDEVPVGMPPPQVVAFTSSSPQGKVTMPPLTVLLVSWR